MALFILGLGSGVQETMAQRRLWGGDRHSAAGRYGQAPSSPLLWAKEFQQAMNLSRDKASPPLPTTRPGNSLLQGEVWLWPASRSRPDPPPTPVKSQVLLLLVCVVQPLPGLLCAQHPSPGLCSIPLLSSPFSLSTLI